MGNRDKNFQLSPPGQLLAICFHTDWQEEGGTEEMYRIILLCWTASGFDFQLVLYIILCQTLVYVTVEVSSILRSCFWGKIKKNEIYELYSIDRIYRYLQMTR